MGYDPKIKYKSTYFRELAPRELKILFEEARVVVLKVHGLKLIRKVTNDIARMRLLLNGFDSVYNEEHRCLAD